MSLVHHGTIVDNAAPVGFPFDPIYVLPDQVIVDTFGGTEGTVRGTMLLFALSRFANEMPWWQAMKRITPVVATALPVGLVLDSATGGISGKPTTTGTRNFEVEVTSKTQRAIRALSITIN